MISPVEKKETYVSTGNETNEENSVNKLINNLFIYLLTAKNDKSFVKSFSYKAAFSGLIEAFNLYAKSKGWSFSQAVLLAIAEFLRNHGVLTLENFQRLLDSSVNNLVNNLVNIPVNNDEEKPESKTETIKKRDWSYLKQLTTDDLISRYRRLLESSSVDTAELAHVAFELKQRGVNPNKL